MTERIPLRAFYVTFDDENRPSLAGIALPDGRMIVAEGKSHIGSYSSECMLLKQHPGGRLYWNAGADAAINHVKDVP
jgi:hypothetical protein